jgi:dihydrofolate reductase
VTALVLVAAVADNGVIGLEGSLPWWLPSDLKHFKKITMGKPIVMGRRTFASIGRPLPGRSNIVLSANAGFRAEGVQVAPNLDAALAIADEEAKRLGAGEIAVIGGHALYAETLPRAARIYLTEVHAKPDGNVNFPAFDKSEWNEVSREGPLQGAHDAHPYSFVILDRR